MSVQYTYLCEYEAGENSVASKLLISVIGKHMFLLAQRKEYRNCEILFVRGDMLCGSSVHSHYRAKFVIPGTDIIHLELLPAGSEH